MRRVLIVAAIVLLVFYVLGLLDVFAAAPGAEFLFTFAGFGGSRSSSSTSAETNTFNLGLQDIDGPAVANVGGSTSINVVDAGAFELAERNFDVAAETVVTGTREAFDFAGAVAGDAFAFAGDAGERAYALGRDALDHAGDARREALTFAGDASDRALGVVERSSGDAFAFAAGAQGASLDVADRAYTAGFDLARDLTTDLRLAYEGVADTVARTGQDFLGAVTGFQARESSNTDARLQDITRTGLIVAGVVAAAALIAWSWKG